MAIPKTTDDDEKSLSPSWIVSTTLLVLLILSVHAFGVIGGVVHFLRETVFDGIRLFCILSPTVILNLGAELNKPDSADRTLYSSMAHAVILGQFTFYLVRILLVVTRRNHTDPARYRHYDVAVGLIVLLSVFTVVQFRSGGGFGHDEVAVLRKVPGQVSWFVVNLVQKGPGLLSDWSQVKYSELKMRYRGIDLSHIMDVDL